MSEILKVREYIKETAPPADATHEEIRALREEASAKRPIPAGVDYARIDMGGVAAEKLTAGAPGSAAEAIVHLHGGGYVFGSPTTHRSIGASLAKEAGVSVYMVDYRLAPEHPFPAALDDSLAAWDWLVGQGIAPDRIAVSGDSAGGGLAIALSMKLRERGQAVPASLLLMSPWVDIGCGFDTYDLMEGVDPTATRDRLLGMARRYVGKDGDLADPMVSPWRGDLTGLPPMLIQVGGSEAMMGDAIALYGQAKRCGVQADLEVWPEMIHVWHQYTDMLADAREALAQAAAYAARHWAASARTAAE